MQFVELVKDKVLRLRLKIKSSDSELISGGGMAPLPHLKYEPDLAFSAISGQPYCRLDSGVN